MRPLSWRAAFLDVEHTGGRDGVRGPPPCPRRAERVLHAREHADVVVDRLLERDALALGLLRFLLAPSTRFFAYMSPVWLGAIPHAILSHIFGVDLIAGRLSVGSKRRSLVGRQ